MIVYFVLQSCGLSQNLSQKENLVSNNVDPRVKAVAKKKDLGTKIVSNHRRCRRATLLHLSLYQFATFIIFIISFCVSPIQFISKVLCKKGPVTAVQRKANTRVSSISLFVDQLHDDLSRVRSLPKGLCPTNCYNNIHLYHYVYTYISSINVINRESDVYAMPVILKWGCAYPTGYARVAQGVREYKC